MSKRKYSRKEETIHLLESIGEDLFESSDEQDEVLLDKRQHASGQDRKGHKKYVKSKKQCLQDLESEANFSYLNQPLLKQCKVSRLKFKRQVNLLSGVSIIIGSIVGSGIFISPKGVFQYSGSATLSLIIWGFCGLVSLFGALCYAELGTLIPLSGGDYVYLLKAFKDLGPAGSVPSFLFLWTSLLVFSPSSSAILSITTAEYIVEPFYKECQPPVVVKKLVATLCMLKKTFGHICTLLLASCSGQTKKPKEGYRRTRKSSSLSAVAFINCYSVKLTTVLNNLLTSAKLFALVIIIIGGISKLIGGGSSHTLAKEGSLPSISGVATAIYFGMWAYGGWNSLNWLTEEINNPERNIPRAIMISIPLVTVFYVLANLAYLSTMSSNEFLASEAVALAFANNVLGYAAFVIPVLVSASALGCNLVGCFGMARLACVAAREGHLMSILSYIHIETFTPIPAVLFNLMLGIMFVYSGTFDTLINFLGFSVWIFFGLTMIALIYMRKSKKHHPRPYKVPLAFPIIVLLFSGYLVVAPLVQDPRVEYLYAFLFIISGLVFYIPFIHYKLRFHCFDILFLYLQLLLQVAPIDSDNSEDL